MDRPGFRRHPDAFVDGNDRVVWPAPTEPASTDRKTDAESCSIAEVLQPVAAGDCDGLELDTGNCFLVERALVTPDLATPNSTQARRLATKKPTAFAGRFFRIFSVQHAETWQEKG